VIRRGPIERLRLFQAGEASGGGQAGPRASPPARLPCRLMADVGSCGAISLPHRRRHLRMAICCVALQWATAQNNFVIMLSSRRSSALVAVVVMAASFLASAPRVSPPHPHTACLSFAAAGWSGPRRFTVNSSIGRDSQFDHEAHRILRFATLAVIQTPSNILETELTRFARWPSARPLRRLKILISRADNDDPLA